MRKKIVIHTGNLSIGGQEKMTMEFLKILSPEKYDIKLLIEEDKGDENYYEKDIPTNVNYEFLTPKSFIDELLRQKRSKKIIDKIKYSINLIKKKEIAIKNFEKESKGADLIIDYNLGLLRNIHKIKNLNSKVIGWSHLGNGEPQKRKQKEKNMLMYSSIVTINEKMKKGFENNYGKKGLKIYQIDNFIDEDTIYKKSEECYSEELGKFILSVGALTERKNYLELIQGYSEFIKKSASEVNLVIIGEGNQKDILELEIKKLGLEKRVFLLGRKENPYPYIKKSEFFILPSKEEGFPVVLMEAMTLGKAIVAKKNSGNIEVLKDGRFGIIVEDVVKDVSNVFLKLLTDVEYKKKYEGYSLDRAKDFSKKKAIYNIDNFLKNYL